MSDNEPRTCAYRLLCPVNKAPRPGEAEHFQYSSSIGWMATADIREDATKCVVGLLFDTPKTWKEAKACVPADCGQLYPLRDPLVTKHWSPSAAREEERAMLEGFMLRTAQAARQLEPTIIRGYRTSSMPSRFAVQMLRPRSPTPRRHRSE